MSENKKIDVYTGLEFFFQPKDSIPLKEVILQKRPEYTKYRIIEFNLDHIKNKLLDLKIVNVPEYIPFLECPTDYTPE